MRARICAVAVLLLMVGLAMIQTQADDARAVITLGTDPEPGSLHRRRRPSSLLHHPDHPVTWFWTNSGNPNTFRESKIADKVFLQEYGITLTNLEYRLFTPWSVKSAMSHGAHENSPLESASLPSQYGPPKLLSVREAVTPGSSSSAQPLASLISMNS